MSVLVDTPWGKIPPEARRAADLPAVPDGETSGTAFSISDDAVLLVQLIAAHHGCLPVVAIERAVTTYCGEVIGLQRLADLKQEYCVGGAVVARRSQAHHKPKVEGSQGRATGLAPSYGPPATSIAIELADLPEFDRANVGRPRPPP